MYMYICTYRFVYFTNCIFVIGCGSSLCVSPHADHLYLVGTEEGKIYKCSKAYKDHYLDVFEVCMLYRLYMYMYHVHVILVLNCWLIVEDFDRQFFAFQNVNYKNYHDLYYLHVYSACFLKNTVHVHVCTCTDTSNSVNSVMFDCNNVIVLKSIISVSVHVSNYREIYLALVQCIRFIAMSMHCTVLYLQS